MWFVLKLSQLLVDDLEVYILLGISTDQNPILNLTGVIESPYIGSQIIEVY